MKHVLLLISSLLILGMPLMCKAQYLPGVWELKDIDYGKQDSAGKLPLIRFDLPQQLLFSFSKDSMQVKDSEDKDYLQCRYTFNHGNGQLLTICGNDSTELHVEQFNRKIKLIDPRNQAMLILKRVK